MDIRRSQDTTLSLAALSLRQTVTRGPTDSASSTTTAVPSSKGADPLDEMEGPTISFTVVPPNSDKFEIKRYIEDTVLAMLSQKHLEEVDGYPLAQEGSGSRFVFVFGLEGGHGRKCGELSTPSRSRERSTKDAATNVSPKPARSSVFV